MPSACARSMKRAQIVRRSVQARRRVQIDAVVAPAQPPGEIGHRHHLDHGDADVGETRSVDPAAAAHVPSGVNVPTCSS